MRLNSARAKGKSRTGQRRGTAILELAILLPVMAFVFLVATDFARIYHDYLTITDSSRNAALYASLNSSQPNSAYQAGIVSAALADVNGLTPAPTVATSTGSLGQGNNYVDVTVNYTFKTMVNFPGIPNSVALNRTTRMRVIPSTYRMQ